MKPMSFERFGKISYVAETKTREFIKYLEEEKIAATQCKKCQKLHFPPRADCDACLSSEMEWAPLSGKCKLITYTNVHFAPTSFRYDAPYTLAVAQLKEGPLVFAPLSKGIPENEVKIGMELKLTPVKMMGDRIIYEIRKP
ncbi:MAG: hypothetical protein AOA65_0253 [Candidatus Bathyarchaeota archaeon BA1]|nr:MAG: hypothetical protein AOA65_0253 [Candidatus Bathyarchaeota archaeon BA1]